MMIKVNLDVFARCFRLLLIIIGVSLASHAYGQLQYGLNKDSLKRILSTSKDDTLKAKTLITLGQQYENNQPDSAVYFYRLAGRLSQQLQDIPGIIRYISNYTAVLNVQGKFNQSLQLNQQAVKLAQKYGLKRELMKSLINTGAVYQYIEAYQQAATYYLQALPLVLAAGNPQNISFCYGNLCGLYRNLKQPQKSLIYARKALALARKSNDRYAEASAYINLGNSLKDLERLPEALVALKEARQLSRQIGDTNLEETSLIDIGDAHLQLEDTQASLQAYQQALPMAISIDDVSGTAFAMHGVALGMFYSKRFARAETAVAEGIGYARTHNQKEVLSRMLLLMSDVQVALGHLYAAQHYRAQYDSLSSELLNPALMKNIQELETRYETEKRKRELIQKDRELDRSEHESKRQRQWLIILVAGLVILCIVVVLIYRLYLQKQQLHLQEQDRIRLASTLEGEQQERRRISQEIHDDLGAGLTRMLFLSRGLASAATSAQLTAAAEELIRKMNEVIWMMNDGQDTLAGLVAHLRSTIAELLDQAGVDYLFDVPEPVPDLPLSRQARRHVYLAAKEAVHNIVKHAGATRVQISMAYDNAQLTIIIHDNGKGLKPVAGHQGNGLRNMHSRMAQLNGVLHVSGEKGTRLVFNIPLG